MMRKYRRLLWWALAGPLVALVATVLWAFPFLAITAPSGSKVLVVEGWMDPGALQEAAALAVDSGYRHIYTTGTVRPFAYLLNDGEGLELELQAPAQGKLDLEVAGNIGAGFILLADGDTLLSSAVAPDPRLFRATAPRPLHRLRFMARENPSWHGPAIFIRALSLNGTNVNYLQRASWFIRPGQAPQPAWPTYAQSARSELIGMGIPESIITAVPAYGEPRSRSWGNAHAFSIQAAKDGITAFDVATVGVHARRSRSLFQRACGPSANVGVIALNDPYCTRENWWKSVRGWFTLLKEVAGAPEADAVSLKRLDR